MGYVPEFCFRGQGYAPKRFEPHPHEPLILQTSHPYRPAPTPLNTQAPLPAPCTSNPWTNNFPPSLWTKGEEKTKYGWLKMVMLTIIAGCYVGFGFSLCLLIGGNIGLDIYRDRPGLFNLVFGAVGFPTGFTFIVICGGELFTSLCAYMAAAWWEGRATVMQCMR